MDGEVVILPGDDESSLDGAGDWPGRAVGLSPREAEIVALITQGLSNQEIADRIFLSVNSVKTYIRTAYRTHRRCPLDSGGLWGVENGFQAG